MDYDDFNEMPVLLEQLEGDYANNWVLKDIPVVYSYISNLLWRVEGRAERIFKILEGMRRIRHPDNTEYSYHAIDVSSGGSFVCLRGLLDRYRKEDITFDVHFEDFCDPRFIERISLELKSMEEEKEKIEKAYENTRRDNDLFKLKTFAEKLGYDV